MFRISICTFVTKNCFLGNKSFNKNKLNLKFKITDDAMGLICTNTGLLSHTNKVPPFVLRFSYKF